MTFIPSAPRFHSPSAPLKAALSALNSYDAYTNAMEALKAPLGQARTELHDAQSTASLIAATLADRLLTVTAAEAAEEIETSAREASQAADTEFTASAKVKLLEAAEQQIGTELDRIIRGGYDKLLRHLNGALQDAYRRSWALGLRGIEDAEAAIAAGKADEWATMVNLRTTIFHIRDAQLRLVSQLGSHEAFQRVRTFGTLRNYGQLFPAWLEVQRGKQWGRQDLTAPWPTEQDGTPVPAELHAWILDNPETAEPWIPTDTELMTAVKTAQAQAHAAFEAQEV